MSFYTRKSPRIQNYDYSTENFYFITICTAHRRCFFGTVSQLNIIGKIAREQMEKLNEHYPNVHVEKYVIMPNHVHMILSVRKSGENDVQQVIAQYKSGVSREARKIKSDLVLWQRSFHDHIIRNQKQFEKIWLYIEANPMRWEEDCFYMASEETDRFREGQ